MVDHSARIEQAEQSASTTVPLRRFRRFSEIETYVETVVTARWWSERFCDAPLEVVLQRRSRSATFSAAAQCPAEEASGLDDANHTGVIWLVDGHGWGLETVLHELAHLAAGTDAAHGERFVEALGDLWRHEAGIEAWAALTRALDAFNVVDRRDAEQHDGSPRPPRHP